MTHLFRRRLRQLQNSFPAGGILVALLLGYFAYRKFVLTPAGATATTAITWRDVDGVEHGGSDFDDYRATVFVFTSTQCPCADLFSTSVARLAEEFTPQGARFYAVFSNGDDSVAEIRKFVSARKFAFPAVKDERGELSTRLRSVVTPSAIILDPRGVIQYQGAVGALPEKDGAGVDCRQFSEALKTVIAGDAPPPPQVRAIGCAIVAGTTAGLPVIEPQDNRQPAGRLEHGVLTVRLVAAAGVWQPETKDGAGFPMYAFGEEGKPLTAPAPLIRVPAGTLVRVKIRNTLAGEAIAVHAPYSQRGDAQEATTIPPGEEREVSWRADEPGNFLYWANIGGERATMPDGKDALLSGGFIVDPAGTTPDPRERVFILNEYAEYPAGAVSIEDIDNAAAAAFPIRIVLAINGLTWPYTEPLRYELGEQVRWRVLNATPGGHPMHLHGFFFDVLSRNDGRQETAYPPGEREKSVTERIPTRGAVHLEWTPHEAGRWLFHCHMAAHFSSRLRLRPPGKGPIEEDEHKRHALEDMSGLVLGIDVQSAAPAPPKGERGPARALTLHVREHGGRVPMLSYYPVEGLDAPAPDTKDFNVPGATLVLTRGERTQIKVVNHLDAPTAVHWHGIELESYYDGVVGWGGHSSSVTPSIPAGGSFVAEMTPPRAGTFIYHAHFDDDRQLRAGLYGAIVVVEPGQTFDPEKERVMVISTAPTRRSGLRLNGSVTPDPMQLKAGQTYRLRFVNITLNSSSVAVQLTNGDTVASWRAVAKDGAALPPARAKIQPARQQVTVGETRDFEFTPTQPGEMRLAVVSATGTPLVAMPVFVQ